MTPSVGEQAPWDRVAQSPRERSVALVFPAREIDSQHEPDQSGGEDRQADTEGRVRQAGCEEEKAAGQRVGEEDQRLERAAGKKLVGDDVVEVERDRDEREAEQRSRGSGECHAKSCHSSGS
jgi:hypothetical protein